MKAKEREIRRKKRILDHAVEQGVPGLRVKTRTYIRLLIGEAISEPSMYVHPESSLGGWPLGLGGNGCSGN